MNFLKKYCFSGNSSKNGNMMNNIHKKGQLEYFGLSIKIEFSKFSFQVKEKSKDDDDDNGDDDDVVNDYKDLDEGQKKLEWCWWIY